MHTSIQTNYKGITSEKEKHEKIKRLVDIFNLFYMAENTNEIPTNFRAKFEESESYISVPFVRNYIDSRMMQFIHSYFDSLKHYVMYYLLLPIKDQDKKNLNFERFLSSGKNYVETFTPLFSQIFRTNSFPFSIEERFFDSKELCEYKIPVDDNILHNFECFAALVLIKGTINHAYLNKHGEPSIIPRKGNNLFRLSFPSDKARKVFMEDLKDYVGSKTYDFNCDIKPYLSFETQGSNHYICVNTIDNLQAISKTYAGSVRAMFNTRVRPVDEDKPRQPGKIIRLLCEMIGYIIGQDVKNYHAHKSMHDNSDLKQLFVPLKNGANKLTLEEIDVINKYFGINIIKLYETDRCNFYDQGKKIHRPEFMTKKLFSAIDLTDHSIMQTLYKELVKDCEISAAQNSLEMKPMLSSMRINQQQQSSSIQNPGISQHREKQEESCTIS